MDRLSYTVLLGLAFFAINHAVAQIHPEFRIVVKDGDDYLEGVTIELRSVHKNYTGKTGAYGSYVVVPIEQGVYTISAYATGYVTYRDTLTIGEKQHVMREVSLFRETAEISEVTITGKTETQQVREQALRAVVVDTRDVAEQPATLAELMNRSPGIRIRQSGGLGNQVDISINGFQGNSVQYFRDGIPLDYLGGGYGINNVPINQLERVEVYKGVIPVSLGGDVLGGAVNLVTQRHLGTNVNASYEIASFNTHIANLSFYHNKQDSRWFVGADAFYNYSDNDYRADVEVVDEHANPLAVTVPLFHNAYKQYFAEFYGGFTQIGWADELRFSVAAYNIDRESQHPALMTRPYGALTVHNKGFIPSMRYRKDFNKVSIDQFVSYGLFNRSRIDTIGGTFDWYGNFTERTSGGRGESPRPSQSDIDFNNLTSRTNIGYVLSDRSKVEANIVYNYISRIGEDPFGFRFQGTDIDVLSKEATYTKTIAGLAWESKWLDDRLTNQLIGKVFHFSTKGIDAFMANAVDLDNFTTYSNSDWGIGNAVKVQLTDRDFIRASFELTNRLPRENELFGDNDTRAPNFQLEPERSFNINVGYRYQQEKLTAEANAFYRKTKGMILLVPVQPPFAQYRNLDSIRGYGFDIDLSYNVIKTVQLTANATWQDNRMVDIGDGLYKWIEGTRVRNTPYFFANAGVVGTFESVLTPNDRIKPYLHWNFIREFYLNHIPRDSEPQGFLGLFGRASVPVTSIVPDQHLLTVGLNYFLSQQPISFGLEVKNLADAKLYDYYKIQRPGRSFHFKINYQLSKKS